MSIELSSFDCSWNILNCLRIVPDMREPVVLTFHYLDLFFMSSPASFIAENWCIPKASSNLSYSNSYRRSIFSCSTTYGVCCYIKFSSRLRSTGLEFVSLRFVWLARLIPSKHPKELSGSLDSSARSAITVLPLSQSENTAASYTN